MSPTQPCFAIGDCCGSGSSRTETGGGNSAKLKPVQSLGAPKANALAIDCRGYPLPKPFSLTANSKTLFP